MHDSASRVRCVNGEAEKQVRVNLLRLLTNPQLSSEITGARMW